MRILIIEDQHDLAQTLYDSLKEYFMVDLAYTGKDGRYQAQINTYDVIILDLTLPDISGKEVCLSLRKDGISTPILILTAVDKVQEKIALLDVGADDYLTKPFHFPELLARVRAILRRNPDGLLSQSLQIGDLSLNMVTRKVLRDKTEIKLRRKEFDLLEYLMRNVGKVLSRDMILEHVWGSDAKLFTNVVDVHVKYLRDRIDRPFSSKLIKTLSGAGYKIEL